jgi:hypothetical protein
MRRHDQEVLGGEELWWEDSGVAADEVGDDPLQQDGHQNGDEGGAEKPAPGPAGDSAEQLPGLRGEVQHISVGLNLQICLSENGRTQKTA